MEESGSGIAIVSTGGDRRMSTGLQSEYHRASAVSIRLCDRIRGCSNPLVSRDSIMRHQTRPLGNKEPYYSNEQRGPKDNNPQADPASNDGHHWLRRFDRPNEVSAPYLGVGERRILQQANLARLPRALARLCAARAL